MNAHQNGCACCLIKLFTDSQAQPFQRIKIINKLLQQS